jgi:hypothetical protein
LKINFYNYLSKYFIFNKINTDKKFDILFYCGDGDRSYNYNSKSYSPLLDSIGDELLKKNYNSITIAAPLSKIYKDKAYGNVVDISFIYIIGLLNYYFFQKIFKGKNKVNSIIEIWSHILNHINPKIIIGIQPPAELCVSARSKGIWIADLQHGVISGEGYYKFKSYNRYGINALPNTILCWDSKSFEWIKHNIPYKITPLISGNPWFTKFNNKQDLLVKQNSIKSDHFFKQLSSNKINILVTLQPGIEDVLLINGIPKGLYNFIIKKGFNYNWLLKLHPSQMNEKFIEQFNISFIKNFFTYNNIFWREPSEIPLPLMMNKISFHFTSHSAVTIEASWFGVKTALLSENKKSLEDFFTYEIKNKFAYIIDDSAISIEEWIKENINFHPTKKKCIYFNYNILLQKLKHNES